MQPIEMHNHGAEPSVAALDEQILEHGVRETCELVTREPDDVVARALAELSPALAVRVLQRLPPERRGAVERVAPEGWADQWRRNESYPEGSIGRLMTPPLALVPPGVTVGDAIERVRETVSRALVTYVFVVDDTGALTGLLTFRDLLYADRSLPLASVMIARPFALRPESMVGDAMKEMLRRHYPVYPVCDAAGQLLGIVRGQTLFEHEAFEISAQAGRMVGVDKEEHLKTTWLRSFANRHPWLQVNLLTAFLAGAVVGAFEHTIAQVVALAVFLPVLTDQSANAGCQTLAVTLRAMTLGEFTEGTGKALVLREAWLGTLNGLLTGVTAALGMLGYALWQGTAHAALLAGVVFVSMTGACAVSGVFGALVPLALRRFGADPVTSSAIFVTTATNVSSVALFLGAASIVL
jgi:magnesium transporter